MSGSRIPLHGRNHLPGGSDPIPVGPFYPGLPQFVPLHVPFPADDSAHWNTFTIDSSARLNGYLESDGSQDAYIKRKVTLGPQGGLFSFVAGFVTGPDAGIIQLDIASVPSPNPVRGGTLATGSLQPDGSGGADPLTFVGIGTEDSYAASATNSAATFTHFRLMGVYGAPLTNISTTDDFVPSAIGDGGPGVYSVKLSVNGKNASSSGYVLRVTELYVVRLDDSGFA